MKTIKTLLLGALMALFLVPAAHADGKAVLASGAGYKKMVNALNAAYQKSTGRSMDLLFGNMARVTTLARQSGQVDIVLGDQSFLRKAGLPLAVQQELGKGRLVLAFAKGGSYTKIEDLDSAGRIALPDVKKAIYGKAAREFLQNTGRLPDIKPRLVEVSTVPQVFSYLATNEVDMGFMNLTHTLNVVDKLGGYVAVDETKYSPIVIMAALLGTSQRTEQAKAFLAFLKTPEAVKIVRENGL
jgi:molybdate transport system substrate-binding protein